MANVKNGAFRESIIDRCLQSRRGYSTQEIFDKCNDALERRGELPISALNTIRNDILSIENRGHIVVEQIRSGQYHSSVQQCLPKRYCQTRDKEETTFYPLDKVPD